MIPFHKTVKIVMIDQNGLTALEKPASIKSIPNDNNVDPSALVVAPYNLKLRTYCGTEGENFYLLNRLDSPTSGVLIGCTNAELAKDIKAVFISRGVKKVYSAITKYKKIAPEGIWKSFLSKNKKEEHLRMDYNLSCGKKLEAITRYKVEDEFEFFGIKLMKIKLFPVTGRTHQLRVHCAQNGIPILGDKIYGDFNFNKMVRDKLNSALKNRLFLHSESIEFHYNFRQETFHFFAQSGTQLKIF